MENIDFESLGMGEGPSLEDFISSTPDELPTFRSLNGDDDGPLAFRAINILYFSIYVDGHHSWNDNTHKHLSELRDVLQHEVRTKADEFKVIWHAQSFKIDPVAPLSDLMGNSGVKSRRSETACLEGSLTFGDSMEDEWFVTACLFQATVTHPSLSVSLMDNDGQFLLIETAHLLPKRLSWLDPGPNSDHRVWVRGGELYVLDAKDDREATTNSGPHPEEGLMLSTALRELCGCAPGINGERCKCDERRRSWLVGKKVLLTGLRSQTMNGRLGWCTGVDTTDEERCVVTLAPTDGSKETRSVKVKAVNLIRKDGLASSRMREHLRNKLAIVFSVMRDSRHCARCVLPTAVARLLYQYPQLVSRIIQSFHTRSVDDTKRVSALPRTAELVKTGMVEVGVWMTKCLFGQLEQAQFHPPKCIQKNLQQLEGSQNADGSWSVPVVRGCKLLMGLEILHRTSKRKKRNEAVVEPELSDRDIPNAPLEGLWRVIDLSLKSSVDDDAAWLTEMTGREQSSESWMNVTVEELEDMFTSHLQQDQQQQQQQQKKKKKGEEEGVERLEGMVDGVKRFLSTQSSVTGVELPDESGLNSEQVSFDMDAFLHQFTPDHTPASSKGEKEELSSDDDEDDDEDAALENEEDYLDDDDDDDDDFFSQTLQTQQTPSENASCMVSHFVLSDEDDGVSVASAVSSIDSDDESVENDRRGPKLEDYMSHMDHELDTSKVLKQSFERQEDTIKSAEDENDDDPENDDDDVLTPVDVDKNLVKNILESFASQDGSSGPASNLLREMGLSFPNA